MGIQTKIWFAYWFHIRANVHVLYPENEAKQIYEFIKDELVAYCENGHYICDRIGFGAKKV